VAQNPTPNPALSGNPQSATGPAYPDGSPDLRYNLHGVKNTGSAVPLHETQQVVHDYAPFTYLLGQQGRTVGRSRSRSRSTADGRRPTAGPIS